MKKYFAPSLKLTLVMPVYFPIVHPNPLAWHGVAYKPIGASALVRKNLAIYGLGGVIVLFIGIKVIDLVVGLFI